MSRTLPLHLPSRALADPSGGSGGGSPLAGDLIDNGGYDFKIGGHGFRLATDQQNPYQRETEPSTNQRFDNSLEPGEQSLAPLPWIKSQSSFHGGAGQLNLEQGFTSFQYQQEQVEHIRFDNCLGVDVWTPGKVSRLPTTLITGVVGDYAQMITAAVGNVDYALAGGVHTFKMAKWTSGPDAAPTVTDVNLTGATFGGASNCTVSSLATDGANYYALIQLASAGSIAGVKTLLVTGAITSTSAPTVLYTSASAVGALGWVKARLVGGLGRSLYELDTNPPSPPVDISTLTAKYTHPSSAWVWTCFAESPTSVLGAGIVGGQSTILEFALNSSGAVPTLSGGASVAVLPPGEQVTSLGSLLGSFLGIGTSKGLRVGTFDTYTGHLSYGPLSVTTTAPVLSMTGRDRFIFAGYSNQQADGTTGLVRVDLSFTVDASGRLAYAPDLRPPSSAPTGHGAVKSVGLLPQSGRLIFISDDGMHVESGGPSNDGEAWLRTSRIRYDTTEMKLFKTGRITGTLDNASISVLGVSPFGGAAPLGVFGFLTDGNPGEFGLPAGLHEWIQLQFGLNGAACELSSYQAKAYPAPARQHIITLTANCFASETDRTGLEVVDPESPRTRYENVRALEQTGDEVRFVEFTNQGPVAEQVLIDQLAFITPNRPSIDDDFGGLITFKLRITE